MHQRANLGVLHMDGRNLDVILGMYLIEQWLSLWKCYLCKLFVGQNNSVKYWTVYFTNHILYLLAFADVTKE